MYSAVLKCSQMFSTCSQEVLMISLGYYDGAGGPGGSYRSDGSCFPLAVVQFMKKVSFIQVSSEITYHPIKHFSVEIFFKLN